MKKILVVVVFFLLMSGLAFLINNRLSQSIPDTAVIKKDPLVIGFSLGPIIEDRWDIDRDLFVKKAEELGAVVRVAASHNNVQTQISEIRNLISQGVKVIVVVPSDTEEVSSIIEEAHQAGVKVVAYDRLIKNSNLDFYVSFDNYEVGRLEAESVLEVKDSGNFAYIGGSVTDNNAFLLKDGSMSVLQDKIDSGQIKLVLDKFSDGWKLEEAYKAVKEYLAGGGHLDAVVAANDGTASGVIMALSEFGLAGKVPVSGQDAELSACQRIVDGTQTSTVYKPIAELADQAAMVAVAIAKGESPKTDLFINNGKIDVPSYLLDSIIVNRDNLDDTVIKDGFHSYKDIYKK